MTRAELNLTFLRGETERGPGGDAGPYLLSRRQLLQGGGTLALAAAGVNTLLQGAANSGPVTVARDGQRAVLRVGGQERWVIDARRFGGSPQLSVTEQGAVTRISLAGAQFPGTALSADLDAELRRVRSAWRLRLALAVGGFKADVPLLEWLAGTTPARARIRLDQPALALGPTGGALQLKGTAEATLTPDWQLRLAGQDIARLNTPEVQLSADDITFALLPSDAPSLLQHAAGRRTGITLQRNGKAWEAWPGLAALDQQKIAYGQSPFDQVRIEAHETQQGALRQALVAEGAALAYVPGPDLTHLDGSPARLGLHNPRYALAFSPESAQAALVARFSQEPTWVQARGLTLHLGDAPHARPFELVVRDGEVVRRSVAPAVLSMAASMPGAIVEPLRSAEAGAHAEIVTLNGQAVAAATEPAPRPTPSPTFPIDIVPIQIVAPAAYISVLRPVDMLHFEVKFLNLRLMSRKGGVPFLERQNPNQDAYLLFRFPPQHIAEKVYLLAEAAESPPIPHRAAGPSWLAFKLPTATKSLDYTLESLLNWSAWSTVTESHRVDPTNNDKSTAPITAIEAPYRVFLSPTSGSKWVHHVAPHTLDDRTELWHTKLTPGVSRARPGVRAIWSPDYTPDSPPDSQNPPLGVFRYSMNARQRYELVALSPVPLLGPAQDPIKVENLMLTSQGAWLKLEGKWKPGPGLKLAGWRHEATMGRDQFVKVLEQGYLYPFGHLALKITETQRRVENAGAYLRQREYIVVVEKERTYPGAEGESVPTRISRNRNLPLRKVTVLTTTTPNLDPSEDQAYQVEELGADAYWPRSGGEYFAFHMVGEDWEGQQIEFATPVIWVSNIPVTADDKLTKMGYVKADYDSHANQRKTPMRGQRIAYAPRVAVPGQADDEAAGDTLLETATLSFTGATIEDGEAHFPPFLPQMDSAEVKVGALSQMTGSPAPKSIKMDTKWLAQGFGAGNPGMVFASFVGKPAIAFGGDKTGAVMTPDMPLAGLSRSHGLVGGDTGLFGAGQFKPETFFEDKAKILGGIALAKIIDVVNDVTASQDKTKVPRITTQLHYPGNDTSQPPDAMNTDLIWTPKLKDFGPFVAQLDGKDATLTITAHLHTPLKAGATPTSHVQGKLDHFTVDLFDCVMLGFDHLYFTSDNGKEPKTDIGLQWVKFTGALEFVQKLKDALGDIFGGGFKLDVEPVGIRASLSVNLPKISLGVFALTNMSLSAGFDLPFTGKPALVNFAFCSRENPFNLSVSMFGGGGFFGLTVGLKGVEILEVALEFGASVSIDLGVASGGVSVKAGIYFKYQTTPKEGALLEGYVKIHGEMSVMLIASLSITLYLSLTYKTPNKCWGQATLTVEVEVLFISFSVDVHAERQFSGDDNDPPFSQMITAGQWSDYTMAFAS